MDNLTSLRLFPSNYKVEKYLGRGAYGEVYKCKKVDTKETVAVKVPVPHNNDSTENELTLLKFFMWKNMDNCNIVRFIEPFKLKDNRLALSFEMLDVTLRQYFVEIRDFKPLPLPEIRSIVQQVATALAALKNNEVIHSDIKLDNIMLMDHKEKPPRVKLIDFGLAFPTCKAKQGDSHQVVMYRAPELVLGLPFSEAIDMWSLGAVMGFLMLGDVLFPAHSNYETMRFMVDLLGLPPIHLLKAGMYTKQYFVQISHRDWRLKTPQEYWEKNNRPYDYRAYSFRNLDTLETLPRANLNMAAAEEKKQCIDLLKAMLQMDPSKRITPSEVLCHPFITRSTVPRNLNNETPGSSTSHPVEPGTSKTVEPGTSKTAEPGTRERAEPGTSKAVEPETSKTAEPGTTETAEPGTKETAEPGTKETAEPGTSKTAEPGTKETAEPGTSKTVEPGTKETVEPETRETAVPETRETVQPGNSVTVQPGTRDTAEQGITETTQPGTSQAVAERTNETLGTSSTFPPHLIFVPPPHIPCGLLLEEETEMSLGETLGSSLPGVVLAQPEQTDKEQETEFQSCCSRSHGPAFPPRVTLGQPERQQREACPVESRSCNMEQDHTELTHSTSDDTELKEERKKNRRRKRNIFRRFFTWMRRSFCCRVDVIDEEG